MEQTFSYLAYLKEELVERQKRNSAYSLRSFARDLKTSPGTLSSVLNGKRPLSVVKAKEWVSLLKWNRERESDFLKTVEECEEKRLNPTENALTNLYKKFKFQRLKLDQFAVIKDWYHLGILNLMRTKGFRSDQEDMALKLGLKKRQVTEALKRLKRLGLVKEVEGKLYRTERPLETPTDLPSEDIRTFHKQVINRALLSLETTPIDKRDITSIMFTCSEEKLSEAKKRIKVFRKEMAEFLGEDQGDKVYSLNVQLFPQSHQGEES